MRILVRKILSHFSQSKIPLSLTYPFEYSLSPNQFTIPDIRFSQLPFSRELAKPEKEHIHHHLLAFQNVLNSGKVQRGDDEYIQKNLVGKAVELKKILEESRIDLHFTINREAISKTVGYLQIKPQDGVSLQEQELKPIHFYRFDRERETLTVGLKPQKETLTAEEQLKKDLKDKMEQQSKEVREQLQNLKLSKHAIFINRFINKLMSIGKPEVKKKFQPYFIIDQIQGVMSCRMTHEGHTYEQNDIPFDSKWLYWVNNLQSDDLKKHRKRTLFDFQYWNRGNFFPIRNYASEVQQYQ